MNNKRELILQAVLSIVMQKGMNGLSISKIAVEADIGKGTIYEYFSSKEQLFIGAIEYGFGMSVDHIENTVSAKEGFQESFKALIGSILEISKNRPFLSFASDSSCMPFSKDTLKEIETIFLKTMSSLMDIITKILCKGVDEGLIKMNENPMYMQALLIIITNMIVHNTLFGNRSHDELNEFLYEACLKLFA